MATYVPNATDIAEPLASQTVESAALEFRTLKTSVNSRITAETAARIAGDAALAIVDANLQSQIDSVSGALVGGAVASVVTGQEFIATGMSAVFTLSAEVDSGLHLDVYVDGAHQQPSAYTVVGTALTLSEIPHIGALIYAKIGMPIGMGTSDASLVQYTPDGTSAVPTTVESDLRKIIWADRFIPLGTDPVTVDVASYINMAFAHAATLGRAKVVFPSAAAFKCNSGLSIDVSTTTVDLCGATLDFSSMLTGNAITFTRSQADGNLQNLQAYAHPICDGILIGPGGSNTAVIAMYIYDVGNFMSGGSVNNIGFLNFGQDVYFSTGSFCWTFNHCNFQIISGAPTTYSIHATVATNSGERQTFNDCMWNNRDLVCLHESANANMFFNSCSFDYSANTVMQVSSGAVFLTGCHIENNSDANYWFAVSGQSSVLSIVNSDIHIQSVKPNYSPFYSNIDCTSGGVILDNVRVTGSNPVTLNPLVGGLGHTVVRNAYNPAPSGTNLASAWQNQLAYGDFEAANYTADWTLSGGAIRSSAQAHAGTYSLSFPASIGVSPAALGIWPCNSTQRFAASLWYLVPAISGTSGTFYITHSFLDKAGNVLASGANLIQTTNIASWTKLDIRPQTVPPTGAVNVQLSVNIFGVASGTPVGYIDDVLVNVY
jgi:hypothetical protein